MMKQKYPTHFLSGISLLINLISFQIFFYSLVGAWGFNF